MSAPPWMPLYIGHYLADTGHLSTAEHGAYLLLIMHYWQNDGLPDDDRRLARICRMTRDEWEEARPTIAELFDGGWRHHRIDEELATARETIEKRSAAGKAGASARHGNRIASAVRSQSERTIGNGIGTTPVEPTPSDQEEASPREPSPAAEPLPPGPPEPALRIEFDMEFWPAWPHKVGRAPALRAFIAARQTASLTEIMDGLARYKSDRPPSRQWLNPETFLNDERFRDEPAPSPVPNGTRPNGHDAIFRALAEQASGSPRQRERDARPDGIDDAERGGASADFDARGAVQIEADAEP